MNQYLSLRCSGGKKRSNGCFALIKNDKFEIGWRHNTMSKVARLRATNQSHHKLRSLFRGEHQYARV